MLGSESRVAGSKGVVMPQKCAQAVRMKRLPFRRDFHRSWAWPAISPAFISRKNLQHMIQRANKNRPHPSGATSPLPQVLQTHAVPFCTSSALLAMPTLAPRLTSRGTVEKSLRYPADRC
jgi:hypothetical protein